MCGNWRCYWRGQGWCFLCFKLNWRIYTAINGRADKTSFRGRVLLLLYSMLQKCMTKEGPKVDLIRPLVKTTWLTLKCFKNPWVWNLPFSYFKLQLTGFQAVFPLNSRSKTVCTKFMLLVSFFPKDITLSFPRKFGKLKNDDEKSF